MIDFLPKLVERKHQLIAEIIAKQNEVATIDRTIENEALRFARADKEGECPDFSMFKGETERLLTAFWEAHNKTLSQEDIRQDVILDEEASDGAVRHVIHRAKMALRDANLPYDIKNIRGKGYRLTSGELSQSVLKQKSIKNSG